MTDKVITCLSEIPLLSSCSNQQLAEIASRMVKTRLKSGDKLIVEGRRGDRFYIIASGTCVVKINNKLESSKIVAKLGPGDYCGEQALLNDKPRNATVQAISDVVALVLNRKAFNFIISDTIGIRFSKRNAICDSDGNSMNNSSDVDTEIINNELKIKTPIERKWIWYTISGNILFKDMTSNQKGLIIDNMYKKECNKGDIIINEGEIGKHFYVIRQGKFEINTKKDGLVMIGCPGECFGELALLYNAPRAATVKCVSNGVLWVLKRSDLRRIQYENTKKDIKENINFLKNISLFNKLSNNEFIQLNDALETIYFESNDTIIKEGDIGDRFYIIKNGEASIIKNNNNIGKLRNGDYFGERALIKNDKRAATIIANTKLTCLTLSRNQFNTLLGSIENVMARDMQRYEQNFKKMINNRESNGKTRRQSIEFVKNVKDFKVLGLLGRGGYGLVKLVKDPINNKTFALKEVRKDKVYKSKQTKHINNERKVMLMFDSPFLVNLWRTYQDENKLYFLIDVCLGGDLFTLLRKSHSFKDNAAKFYAACVIEGFEHIHSMNMAFRDLKPENLIINNNGYIKITDFGFCKIIDKGKTFTLCGTPDYLAPEIILSKGHNWSVDYWTLGILIYEMLISMPPFYDRDPSNIYRKIIRSNPKFPAYLSPDSIDIIKGLLQKKPHYRLGMIKGGINKIRQHNWFKGFDWNKFKRMELPAPHVPKIKNTQDMSNFKCKPKKEEPFKKIDDHSWCKDF